MKTVVIIHNIRSILNVGSILRTSEGFGVSRVIYSGYTPTPEVAYGEEKSKTANSNDDLNRNRTEKLSMDVNVSKPLPHVLDKITEAVHKTALGAELLVPSEYSDDIRKTLSDLKSNGYRIVGLENHVSGRKVHKINEQALETELGKATLFGNKTALLLGEEVNGIPEDLYDLIDIFLEIPMVGKKESFNVSVATGIALYKLLCE